MRLAAVLGMVASLSVAGSGVVEQKPKPITGETAEAIKSWVQAVKTHAPGQADAAAAATAALTYEQREELNAGMFLFLRALLGQSYDTQRNPAARSVVEIGHGAGNPDGYAFLKRAAILHADAAAYGDRFPIRSTAAPRAEPSRSEPYSPLLTRNRIVLNQDGDVLGETVASWNWPFGRSLLDLVNTARGGRATPADDPFVAAWYHATSAYMFASGAYGDLTPHLRHAADVLPDAAPILFDRGCYAELLGLPMHQALLSDSELFEQRGGRGDGPPTWTPPRSSPELRIPAAEKTNAEAERLYRRTLEVDASLLEARVRLARLLDLRGRHHEAAAELKTVLSGEPAGAVAFYAHLFAGRAAQTLGRLDDASRHYQDALAVFPDAQSALLASSRLALQRSDVPAALAPVEQLGDRSAASRADPWWQYHLCAGRDADEILRTFWVTAQLR